SLLCFIFAVIADSLTVTAPAQTLSKVEGDTLQLTCEVSRTTLQHTHLSVGWYLRSPEDASAPPQELVTLSRDFVLRSGGPYRQRMAAGDLRLDKTSATSYRLTIHKLQPVDQGLLYCQAAEWIQDTDGSWFAMTRKQSDKTQLRIQPTDRDFSIQVSTERRSFTAGEPLELHCTIEAQNVPERFFSVSWVFSSSPVAVVGPSAVPVLGPDYVSREAAGHMTVRKESANVHLLKLQHLRPEDAGKYICRVTEREKTPTGDFIDRSKRSRNVQITVQPLKSNITVSLSSNSSEALEGDVIQLTCSVQSTTGPLSVAWQWTDKQATGPSLEVAEVEEVVEVASFDRDGTVWHSPSYSERSSYGEIRVEKVRADMFSLSLYNALPGDEGQYRCTATEWLQTGTEPELNWEKIGEKSATKTVTVKTVGKLTQPYPTSIYFAESKLRVQKTNHSQVFLEDSRVRINCSISSQTSQDSQHAVLWYVRRATGSEADELLLRIERSGAFEYGAYAEEERLRRRVQAERLSTRLYALTLNRAENSDSGTYYCLVEEWLSDPDGAWYRLSRESSGFTQVLVRQPEIRLQVEELESNVTVEESASIRLGCSIPSQSSRDSRFSVSWYVERSEDEDDDDEQPDQEEGECVFSIGHDAVFGNGNCSPREEPGPNSRLQFERMTSDQYSLTIHGARPTDAGRYYCHVQEWLLNPRNAWYHLATNNSGFTIVNVMQQVSTLQSVVCSNDSLFYFVFFYPFPIFGILLIALLLVRYKSRNNSKSQEGKNGAPLLWIKEPHLSYSPTCLDPPALSLHPGSVD
ncbi:immunoglobulin superfamily member 3, partial [Anarrhichthys ocellatus]|uniref:immunoglobulin superfamily member 3 n=1 Tax=Anarrhichthys ocellatus TaxID=433405 RepID=UPI0012ED39AE